MSLLTVTRPRIWTGQPPGAARTSPAVIAAGLASTNFKLNLADFRAVTAIGGTQATTHDGPSINAPRATVSLSSGVKSGYTLIAIITGGANAAENFIGADLTPRWWQFRSNTGGASVQFIPFDTGGTPYIATAPAPPAAPVYVVVATVGGGLAQAWAGAKGGKALSDGPVALAAPNLITSGENIYLGSRDGTLNTLSAGCLGYALLDGGIRQDFAQRLIENPWQIFAPETIPLFFTAAAGIDLYVADALHAHAADNLVLDTTGSASLAIADALHAHTSDGLLLTTQGLLSVAEALHGHAADNATLYTSHAIWLTLQDATHGHAAEGVILTLSTWLSIAESQHWHHADTVQLDPGQRTLAIAEAVHAHLAENLTLSVVYPGVFTRAPAGSGPHLRRATGSRQGSQNTCRPTDLGSTYPTIN